MLAVISCKSCGARGDVAIMSDGAACLRSQIQIPCPEPPIKQLSIRFPAFSAIMAVGIEECLLRGGRSGHGALRLLKLWEGEGHGGETG